MPTLVDTRPYAQPPSPIEVNEDCYALPPKLVDGLVFLAPFVKRAGDQVEKWVHLINDNLLVVTNSPILEFAFGENALLNLMFDPDIIRTRAALGADLQELVIDEDTFLFERADGQELFMQGDAISGPVWFDGSKPMNDARAKTIDKYWNFDDGKPVDDTTRRTLRSALSAPRLHKDVYLIGGAVWVFDHECGISGASIDLHRTEACAKRRKTNRNSEQSHCGANCGSRTVKPPLIY